MSWGPIEDEAWIFWSPHHMIDCTWCNGREGQAFTWHLLLIQSAAISVYRWAIEHGQKKHFRRVLPTETTTMEQSFTLAALRLIVLGANPKKKKYSYVLLTSFSRLQSPSTATAKTAPFPQIFAVAKSQSNMKNGDLIDATSLRMYFERFQTRQNPYMQLFCHDLLYLRLPLKLLEKGENGVFPARRRPKEQEKKLFWKCSQ